MVKVDLHKALKSLGPLDDNEQPAPPTEELPPPRPEPDAPTPRKNPSKRRVGGNSTSRSELDARMQFVETLMSQGAPRQMIMTLVRRQFGHVPEDTIDRYVRKVREEWRERRAEEREYDYEATIERLRRASLKLESKGEWTAWMMCERLLADVRGVRAPQRHVVAIANQGPKMDYQGLSDDELVNLRTLMLKAQQGKALPPVSIGDARVVDKAKG